MSTTEKPIHYTMKLAMEVHAQELKKGRRFNAVFDSSGTEPAIVLLEDGKEHSRWSEAQRAGAFENDGDLKTVLETVDKMCGIVKIDQQEVLEMLCILEGCIHGALRIIEDSEGSEYLGDTGSGLLFQFTRFKELLDPIL